MYLIRRVWRVKPREARRVATAAAIVGKAYEAAGQRSPTTVYFNGGTLPGERDVVVMEWTEDVIQSPYRAGNEFPGGLSELGALLREAATETWIEFYELMTEDKAIDLES